MKNQKVYDKYAIIGFPNFYFSITAMEKHNDMIKKWCLRLPDGVDDLPVIARIWRWVMCRTYLIILDEYWLHKETKVIKSIVEKDGIEYQDYYRYLMRDTCKQ